MLKWVFAAVFYSAVLISSVPCAAAAGTFTVRHVEGDGVVQRAGQTVWMPLHAGEALQAGDRVVSSEGSILQLQSSRGILELTDRTDVLIRPVPAGQSTGSVTLELASGQMKGDWTSDRLNPLTVHVPGGEFQVENGFFSLWIYALLGRPYTRVDLFRGEGFLQETSSTIPLAITEGQYMTAGLPGNQGPRSAPVIPGFDTFEIDPAAAPSSARELREKNTGAVLTAAHT